MIRAYDKTYLEKARATLARMLDFAVYDLKYDPTTFFDMFISSGLASRFENGDVSIVAGRSGVELAYEVLLESGISHRRVEPSYGVQRSKEFWTGWALAYYQWYSSLGFAEIIKHIPITDILALYSPYHEMDIRQFVDKMNELYRAAKPDTNLKTLRKAVGLSQRELAERSGIPLRTIQQYEQRQKDINKAQVAYLIMLAKVLYCDVSELIQLAD